jgi:hypothetical protein
MVYLHAIVVLSVAVLAVPVGTVVAVPAGTVVIASLRKRK